MLRRLGCLLILMTLSPLTLAQTPATGAATTASDPPPPLKPNLKWPTLTQYEAEIGERGVLLQNDVVLLFAPQRKEKEAKVIFDYPMGAASTAGR